MLTRFVRMVLLRSFGHRFLVCAAAASAGCSEQPSARAGKDLVQRNEAAAPAETARRFANVRIMGPDAAPAPEGIATGRFVRRGDCLLFAVDGGKAYNPVIAGEASISRSAAGEPVVTLQGKAISLGRRIKVAGGGSGDVANLSEAQRRCSDSIFVVGEVLDERI